MKSARHFGHVFVLFVVLCGFVRESDADSLPDCTLRDQVRTYLQTPEFRKEVAFQEILESKLDVREVRAGLSSRVGSERAVYVRLLGALQDVESAHAILKLSKDAEPKVRAASLRALAVLDRTLLDVALQVALDDRSAEVRAEAIRRFGVDLTPLRLQRLCRFANDPNELIRVAVLDAIEPLSFAALAKGDKNVVPVILSAISDKSIRVRQRLVRLLASRDTEETLSLLGYLASEDSSVDIRRQAVGHLRGLKDPSQLTRALEDCKRTLEVGPQHTAALTAALGGTE